MNYDDWLEQPYQEQAERDEAIDAEVERLLEDDHNPLDVSNFIDAICDDCLASYEERLDEALTDPNPHFEALGRVLFDAVYAYWRNKAESLAAERYNSGMIGDDRDGGDY